MKFHFKEKKHPEFEEGPKTLKQLMLEDLEKTKYELDTAYKGFDYVTDPDLIDCYIYDINGILKRYKYLLEQVEALSKEDVDSVSDYDNILNTEAPVTALIG